MSPKHVTYSKRPNHAARVAHARGAREFKTYDTSLIRPHKSKLPLIVLTVVAAVLAVVLIVGLVNCYGGNPHLLKEGQTTQVEIAEGSNVDNIATSLYDAGVINNKYEFDSVVSAKNAAGFLQSGTYTFTGGMSTEEVVNQLLSGPGLGDNALSIPEGYTLNQVAEAVQSAYGGSISKDDFLAAAGNASRFAQEYAFVSEAGNHSLEGFLFPKTYELLDNASADDVIRQMLNQYQREVSSLDYSYPEGLDYSPYEVLILASIVEKEANADTRAKVAAVFYNRLTSSDFGTLGSDATTAYEIGKDPEGYNWDTDSPYNTRKTRGLPPTPICSPSLECLQAVCHPEPNFDEYYFFSFWSDENGIVQYYFDKTYEDHQATIAAHS